MHLEAHNYVYLKGANMHLKVQDTLPHLHSKWCEEIKVQFCTCKVKLIVPFKDAKCLSRCKTAHFKGVPGMTFYCTFFVLLKIKS